MPAAARTGPEPRKKGVMALPRTARLRDGRDVQAVSRDGARARAADLSVAVRLGGTAAPRAAVVVGKRAGGAVERNRIRRRLQHLLPPLLRDLPPGADVVVRTGPGTLPLPPAALDAALRSGVRRALARATGRTA